MKKLAATTVFVAVILAMAATALATMGSGVTSTGIAQGGLDPIKLKTKIGDWASEIETEEQSSLVIQENRVAPGGHFGWHSHPGPSLVIVKSGTSTFYRGDDPNCTPQPHPTGSAYVDPGGVVHTARNESVTDELIVIVVRLLPPGVPARIDAPAPGNCPF